MDSTRVVASKVLWKFLKSRLSFIPSALSLLRVVAPPRPAIELQNVALSALLSCLIALGLTLPANWSLGKAIGWVVKAAGCEACAAVKFYANVNNQTLESIMRIINRERKVSD